MKSLIPVLSALILLGCSNDSQTSEATAQASVPPAAIEENTTVPATEATPPVEQAVSPAAETPTEQPAASTPPKPEHSSNASASIDGSALYTQKCASCHGAKAEKPALNKSQIIANFSEAQVKEALKGYQAGTYGKEMKGLMQGQAKALDDAQINALAKHISAL